MARFNTKTKKVLQKAGWYPNRRTDISAIVAKAIACGYNIGENVCAFLCEFDGLFIAYPDGQFLFEFRTNAEEISRENLSAIANIVEENGLEVGATPEVCLIVGDSGRMYGYCYITGEIFLLGECTDEGVAFVCRHGNPFKHPL